MAASPAPAAAAGAVRERRHRGGALLALRLAQEGVVRVVPRAAPADPGAQPERAELLGGAVKEHEGMVTKFIKMILYHRVPDPVRLEWCFE